MMPSLETKISRCDQRIELHVGDRDTRKMILRNLANNGEKQSFEADRKLSFRVNSSTFRVETRVHLTKSIIDGPIKTAGL